MANAGRNLDEARLAKTGRKCANGDSGGNAWLAFIRSRYSQCLATQRLSDGQCKRSPKLFEANVRFHRFHLSKDTSATGEIKGGSYCVKVFAKRANARYPHVPNPFKSEASSLV